MVLVARASILGMAPGVSPAARTCSPWLVFFSEAMSTVPKQRWCDPKPSLSRGTCTQSQQDEEGLTTGRWFPLCSSLLLAWWFGLGEDGTHVVDLLLSVFFLLLSECVLYKVLALVLASLSDLFVSGHSW